MPVLHIERRRPLIALFRWNLYCTCRSRQDTGHSTCQHLSLGLMGKSFGVAFRSYIDFGVNQTKVDSSLDGQIVAYHIRSEDQILHLLIT